MSSAAPFSCSDQVSSSTPRNISAVVLCSIAGSVTTSTSMSSAAPFSSSETAKVLPPHHETSPPPCSVQLRDPSQPPPPCPASPPSLTRRLQRFFLHTTKHLLRHALFNCGIRHNVHLHVQCRPPSLARRLQRFTNELFLEAAECGQLVDLSFDNSFSWESVLKHALHKPNSLEFLQLYGVSDDCIMDVIAKVPLLEKLSLSLEQRSDNDPLKHVIAEVEDYEEYEDDEVVAIAEYGYETTYRCRHSYCSTSYNWTEDTSPEVYKYYYLTEEDGVDRRRRWVGVVVEKEGGRC